MVNNQTINGSAKCLPSMASEVIVNAANGVNNPSLKMVKCARLIRASNVLPVTTSDNQDFVSKIVAAVMGLRILASVHKKRAHQRLLALMHSNRLFSTFFRKKRD